MKYLPQEVGTAWVYSPLGMSLGVSKPMLSLPLVGGIYHTLSILNLKLPSALSQDILLISLVHEKTNIVELTKRNIVNKIK